MTQEEAQKILEQAHNENAQTTNRILTGLQILAKYDNKLDVHIWFEHDQIGAGGFNEKMTAEDVREMGLHGWFLSEEFDCWSHF